MKNLSESIIMSLNEDSQRKYPMVSPSFEEYGDYGSVTNDDAYAALDELISYIEDYSEAVSLDGMHYQCVDSKKLDQAVELLRNAKNLIIDSFNDC